MAQNLNPSPKNQNEKLQFLKREEIKTMQKDIGKLREAEAGKERTRIGQIKTAEEIEKEKKGREQAKIPPAEIKKPRAKPEPIKTEAAEKEKDVPFSPAAGAADETKRSERDLFSLSEQKKRLEAEAKTIRNEIEDIQITELKPVLREEKTIEESKKILEEQERNASFQDRQAIETKRWEIEEKRKEVEERKWRIGDKIREKEQKMEKIGAAMSGLSEKEEGLKSEIQRSAQEVKNAELQRSAAEIAKELNNIGAELQQTEAEFLKIGERKTTGEKTLNEILASEKALEEEIVILEKKETESSVPDEQKMIEQKRWEADKERQETEKEKWRHQATKREIDQQFNTLKDKTARQKKKKTELENKLNEINDLLEKSGSKKIELSAAPISAPVQTPALVEKATVEPAQKTEIKIPEKKPELTPPPPIPTPPSPPVPPPPPLFAPKKETGQIPPSRLKKFLIRAFVAIALLSLISAAAVLVWPYVKDRIKTAPPGPSPSPLPTETAAAVIPPSLIPVSETKFLEIQTYADLQNIFFGNAMQPIKDQERFVRILIKDTRKNQFLGLKEFFETFEIAAPEGFYQKIDNDFTLFAYAASNTGRLGFVAKINDKEGLADLMTNWEKTMEKDFALLLSKGLKSEQPAISSVFKNAYFKKQSFRYQTFTKENFGFCYGIINDYLVFTTSGKSMLKTIDLITN